MYGLHCFVPAASVDISFWITLLDIVKLMFEMFIDHSVDPYTGRSPIGCRARQNNAHAISVFFYLICLHTYLVGTQAFGIILQKFTLPHGQCLNRLR
jgi:hypothetical protein